MSPIWSLANPMSATESKAHSKASLDHLKSACCIEPVTVIVFSDTCGYTSGDSPMKNWHFATEIFLAVVVLRYEGERLRT
jgi:hypothetical protein